MFFSTASLHLKHSLCVYVVCLQGKRDTPERDLSVAHVRIMVLDENDNPPKFERSNYYSGK
jgi:hypothetical protein